MLKQKLDYYFQNLNDITIVSGCANGADKLGEIYATENNLKVMQFPADWEQYGASAGSKRNAEMAEIATHCIAFWDGESRGTEHMLRTANRKGIKVKIVRYAKESKHTSR
jgi:hypothetical protein